MREYPKIETLFERDAMFRVTDVLKRPIFNDISRWIVTEKVDGTNIRAGYAREDDFVNIGGRTDNAQISVDLVEHLFKTITPTKMAALFIEGTEPGTRITLFGEGFGAGIQKGGGYSATKSFILFDVLIECGHDAAYWQDDATVTDFAARLGIPRVPILGEWSMGEIVERVRAGIPSAVATTPRLAEVIVARPREPLFDRRGQRLILKLKTGDFSAGRR